MMNEMRDRLVEIMIQADDLCETIKNCKDCVGYGKEMRGGTDGNM